MHKCVVPESLLSPFNLGGITVGISFPSHNKEARGHMQQVHTTYYRDSSCQSAKTSGDEIKLGQGNHCYKVAERGRLPLCT